MPALCEWSVAHITFLPDLLPHLVQALGYAHQPSRPTNVLARNDDVACHPDSFPYAQLGPPDPTMPLVINREQCRACLPLFDKHYWDRTWCYNLSSPHGGTRWLTSWCHHW